jgi:hemolysin III
MGVIHWRNRVPLIGITAQILNPHEKHCFRIIEHSAIYVLIAGTDTPLTLGVLHGAFGWTLFGIVWGFALSGIAMKAIYRTSHSIISTTFYLVMGWLALIAVDPLLTMIMLNRLPSAC